MTPFGKQRETQVIFHIISFTQSCICRVKHVPSVGILLPCMTPPVLEEPWQSPIRYSQTIARIWTNLICSPGSLADKLRRLVLVLLLIFQKSNPRFYTIMVFWNTIHCVLHILFCFPFHEQTSRIFSHHCLYSDYLLLIMPLLELFQASLKCLFLKGKIWNLRLCGPYGLCHNYSILLS